MNSAEPTIFVPKYVSETLNKFELVRTLLLIKKSLVEWLMNC